MKRVLAICALLLTMTITSYAEEEPVAMSYQDAIKVVRETSFSLASILEMEHDEEVQEIIQFCQYQLALVESGLILVTPEEVLLQDENLFLEDVTLEAEHLEAAYSVAPTYIQDLERGQSLEVYKKLNYVRIKSSVYDSDLLNQQEYVRVEVAIRPESDELMLLLTQLRFDDLMTSSNRYLVYSDATDIKSIFRRTFSTDIEYRINLESWVTGKEYQWNDKLLYPRVSE